MKRFNWTLSAPLMTVAGLLVFAACEVPLVIEAPQEEPLDSRLVVENDLVLTPSGAVFPLQEWNSFEDKSPWLVSLEEWTQRVLEANPRYVSDGVLRSVTGNIAPTVLCHQQASFVCSQIQTLIPGTTIVLWTDAQFIAANVAAFAVFDLIYLWQNASNNAAITGSKNTWGAATTGRLVLTGVHFAHCQGNPSTGPCRVLKDAVDWVHAGTGTGLVLETQPSSTGPQLLPTIPPYNGVSYSVNGGGFDLVRITDPGHATMLTSTDASLSNFGNSSHSIFGTIGGFTSVAEICDKPAFRITVCPPRRTFRPHILVTSVAVADQDGDGVPDNIDNCPTVANADQLDANGNGVGDSCESAPTVTISPSVVSVAPGGSVTFTTTATDADDPLSSLTYEWRVDGLIQAGETGTSFTSTFNADATVRVTVRDPGLLSGFDEVQVTIITNQPPTANAGLDQVVNLEGAAEAAVTLDGSGSSDPDGYAL
ncbi:MAG: thrombospondin type 3 repeat-containing protein, partial [Acidobacteria bacterium]|nr:thrombospondin type 3 repeat-containing protein [Acidobacteriota bacterium]